VSRRLASLAALLAVVLIGAHLLVGATVEPLPTHPFWSDGRPHVIAHRGGRGLWPENTLHAFRNAAALGVDVLEMDLRMTADGEIVVLHDDTVDRTTDGKGAVAALTIAQLRQLDAGYRWTTDGGTTFPHRGQGIGVPSLREVFAALPAMRMNLEIKGSGPAMSSRLCALIGQHAMERRVVVAAVDQAAMDAFRAACPSVATAATRDEATRFAWMSYAFLGSLFAPRAQVLQVPERVGQFELLTPRFAKDSRRLNVKLEVWTINDPSDMQRLLGLPVDGIMTDYPDRLLSLLAR
jgi:glycerophosphoryl diester phosphodiesterase